MTSGVGKLSVDPVAEVAHPRKRQMISVGGRPALAVEEDSEESKRHDQELRIQQALEYYLQAHSQEIDKKTELGTGAFGKVFALTDLSTGNANQAIKILHVASSFQKDRGDYLIESIDSPYIVKTECLYYKEGRILTSPEGEAFPIAIIMPLIKGKSLQQLLDKGPIDEVTALKIVQQIALGLQSLYESRIAHRDLKPDNIMMKEDGSISILDFGTAKRYQSLRKKETPIGTEAYMAPERLACLEIADTDSDKSDVFSLGVIFKKLLGGSLPSYWDKQAPPNLEGIPVKFHDLINGMLMTDPSRRLSIEAVNKKLSELAELPSGGGGSGAGGSL